MMKKINVKTKLKNLEDKFRALPANCGARYAPLWGLCKCAIDAGYNTEDTLRYYIDSIYMSQWGTLEPYIDGTVKHAIADTAIDGKADTAKIEKSKAVAKVREKYAEMTDDFREWVQKNVMTQEVFPLINYDEKDLDSMSAEAMRKIAGDIGDGDMIYVGSGKYDSKGIEGKDTCNVGFWGGFAAPNDADHNSWLPNILTGNYRNREHVKEIHYLAMEMDREMVKTDLRGKERMDYRYEVNQKYWQYILSKKCLSIRSLTYSGGKSIHALIPVVCTEEEFAKKQAKIKAGYIKMYMDDSMVDIVKKTRRPWGLRKYYIGNNNGVDDLIDAQKLIDCKKIAKTDADAAKKIIDAKIDERNPIYIVQELLYLDESAKPMTIDDLLDGMKIIYSEYIREENQVPMPLVWEETSKGGKWTWNGLAIDAYLRRVGIAQYDINSCDTGLVRYDTTRHTLSDLNVQRAWSIIYNDVLSTDVNMAVELRDKYSGKFTSPGLAMYAGNHIAKVKKLMGKNNETYFPYRNGLLCVTKDTAELMPYSDDVYHGDIWDDAPTLKRDWHSAPYTGSEFETFVRHMCGSELEDKALAEKRYNAIRAVLGYEISAIREATNWAIFLTDESLLQSDGGTGKSICLKSIQYMRKMWIRDKVKSAKTASEFDWSNVTPSLYAVGIDECDENFCFREFFTLTTGAWNIRKKFVNGEIIIPENETPSLIFATNFLPKGLAKSDERRKLVYEVSMYYHQTTPCDEFGHILYHDWDDQEWSNFDRFMIECVKYYLANGLQDPNMSNINMDMKKLMVNIPDEITDFLSEYYITKENEGDKLLSNDVCLKYNSWCNDNGRKNGNYSTKKLNEFISRYCTLKGIRDDYKKYKVKTWIDGNQVEVVKVCHCFTFPDGWEDDHQIVNIHNAFAVKKSDEPVF